MNAEKPYPTVFSRRKFVFFFLFVIGTVVIGWSVQSGFWKHVKQGALMTNQPEAPDTLGGRIAVAALWQIDKTIQYDAAYVKLDYPMGDRPIATGVCTDVVIRALRRAADIDLQQCVHEDMKRHFSIYPIIWGMTRPDTNIDHRRVPNLRVYFERAGYSLPVTKNSDDYQAGDIVTCKLPHGAAHIMVVGYQKSWKGIPLTIHNAGGGAGQNDRLFTYKLTGHYRVTSNAQ